MTMQAILQGIVARTNEHQGPHRPQVTAVKPVIPATYEFPVFVDAPPPDGVFGLIYGDGCCPACSAYEPLLVVCLRPLPGYGAEQAGLFSGAIVVYVWQGTAYPLSPPEVDWVIAHDCGCEDHAWAQLPVCWQKTNEICHDDLAPLVAEYAAWLQRTASGPPAPAAAGLSAAAHAAAKKKQRRRPDLTRRGARMPRKQPVKHLLENMRALPDIGDFEHLFPGYLEDYKQSEGRLPAYPRQSFNQAAHACIDRILRERGQTPPR